MSIATSSSTQIVFQVEEGTVAGSHPHSPIYYGVFPDVYLNDGVKEDRFSTINITLPQ